MQCSKCKREFSSGEEVMVEGKGRYSMISEAVKVTDQAAVFCMVCDKASYEEETAGREERPEAGSVADVSGPALASTPEETGTRDVDPRDESNPGDAQSAEETRLTGDAQTVERGGLDSVDMEVDPHKL